MSEKKTFNKNKLTIGIALALVVGFTGYTLLGKDSSQDVVVASGNSANQAVTGSVLTNVDVATGSSNDVNYNRLQEKQNANEFNDRVKKGESFVPKIVNAKASDGLDVALKAIEEKKKAQAQEEQLKAEQDKKALEEQLKSLKEKYEQNLAQQKEASRADKEEQERLDRERKEREEQDRLEREKLLKRLADLEAKQKAIQAKENFEEQKPTYVKSDLKLSPDYIAARTFDPALVEAYKAEVKDLYKRWDDMANAKDNIYIEADFLGVKKSDDDKANPNTTSRNIVGSNGQNQTNVNGQTVSRASFVSAGQIIGGYIQTAVNTDDPSPVIAKISGCFKGVGGKQICDLKGATLIGRVSQANLEIGTLQRATLQFDKIVMPNGDTLNVDVYAVDPSTARTAVASSVDNHYFERYGLGLAASFLQGIGRAFSTSNSTTIVNPGGSTVTTSTNQKARTALLSSLQDVGQQIGNEVALYSKRRPTIYVNSGTPVGFLFMSNF